LGKGGRGSENDGENQTVNPSKTLHEALLKWYELQLVIFSNLIACQLIARKRLKKSVDREPSEALKL
jgi:hypothetical protein